MKENSCDYLCITNNYDFIEKIKISKKIYAGLENHDVYEELSKNIDHIIKESNDNFFDLCIFDIQHIKDLKKTGNQRVLYTMEKSCNYHNLMEHCKVIYIETNLNFDTIKKETILSLENDKKIKQIANNCNLTSFNFLKENAIIDFYCYLQYINEFYPLILNNEYEFFNNDLLCLLTANETEIDYVTECIIFDKLKNSDRLFVNFIYQKIKKYGFSDDFLYNKLECDFDETFYAGKFVLEKNGNTFKFIKCKFENGNILYSENDEIYEGKFVFEKIAENAKENYVILIENNKICKFYTVCEIAWKRLIIEKIE